MKALIESVVSLSPSLSLTGGCSSMSIEDDCAQTLGSLLTSTATSVSISGNDAIKISVHAAQVEQSKAYVQSLTAEEQEEMLILLDILESEFDDQEKGVVYKKTYKQSK